MPAEGLHRTITHPSSRLPLEGFDLRTLIFANGSFSQPENVLAELHTSDRLIAADGGALHCLRLGLQPDIVIGDFDSLEPETLAQLEDGGAELRRYPARKDETDLELALFAALEEAPAEIIVYGALGARWDMTLANLLMLGHPAFQQFPVTLVDGCQRLRLLNGGEDMELQGKPGDTVSLIPLTPDTAGIRTQGLEYALQGEALAFGGTRGVSNVLIESPARISLDQGLLVCVHIQNCEER